MAVGYNRVLLLVGFYFATTNKLFIFAGNVISYFELSENLSSFLCVVLVVTHNYHKYCHLFVLCLVAFQLINAKTTFQT